MRKISERAPTTCVAPAASNWRGSPSRSIPIRTDAILGAEPHVRGAVADGDRPARPTVVRRGRGDLLVVGAALAARVRGAEHDLELPALLLEHLVRALGGGAGAQDQGGAPGGEFAQRGVRVLVGDRRQVAVEVVQAGEEALGRGLRLTGVAAQRLEDVLRGPAGERVQRAAHERHVDPALTRHGRERLTHGPRVNQRVVEIEDHDALH